MTVWSRLKFSDNVDNALSSGKLGMFSKYIAKYYPNNVKSVLERFTVKYGEDAVAKALVTATNKGTMKDFASKLQTQQLEGWLARQKSAGDVFNLLKIKEDGVYP
ncbi:Bzip transcription factor [Phytophthora nicotianae]|nr:Bzip transcription factor [Phytophthora nicotianae]